MTTTDTTGAGWTESEHVVSCNTCGHFIDQAVTACRCRCHVASREMLTLMQRLIDERLCVGAPSVRVVRCRCETRGFCMCGS